MLSAADPLPARPRRVLVCGVAGSGKSTLAEQLGGILDLPYTELDSLHWGPDWTPRPQFVEEVDRLTAGERWISEYGYRTVRERMLGRCDLLVWMDYPSRTTLRRAIARTVRRRLRRETLWHGNVEPPLHTFFTRPDENIVRWVLSTRNKYRELVPQLELQHPDLPIVRLATPHEAEAWMRELVRNPPR